MTKTDSTPNGVKLEITALIDKDLWAELKAQGYSDEDLGEAIKKSIILTGIAHSKIAKSPLSDIMDVELLKYY